MVRGVELLVTGDKDILALGSGSVGTLEMGSPRQYFLGVEVAWWRGWAEVDIFLNDQHDSRNTYRRSIPLHAL